MVVNYDMAKNIEGESLPPPCASPQPQSGTWVTVRAHRVQLPQNTGGGSVPGQDEAQSHWLLVLLKAGSWHLALLPSCRTPEVAAFGAQVLRGCTTPQRWLQLGTLALPDWFLCRLYPPHWPDGPSRQERCGHHLPHQGGLGCLLRPEAGHPGEPRVLLPAGAGQPPRRPAQAWHHPHQEAAGGDHLRLSHGMPRANIFSQGSLLEKGAFLPQTLPVAARYCPVSGAAWTPLPAPAQPGPPQPGLHLSGLGRAVRGQAGTKKACCTPPLPGVMVQTWEGGSCALATSCWGCSHVTACSLYLAPCSPGSWAFGAVPPTLSRAKLWLELNPSVLSRIWDWNQTPFAGGWRGPVSPQLLGSPRLRGQFHASGSLPPPLLSPATWSLLVF